MWYSHAHIVVTWLISLGNTEYWTLPWKLTVYTLPFETCLDHFPKCTWPWTNNPFCSFLSRPHIILTGISAFGKHMLRIAGNFIQRLLQGPILTGSHHVRLAEDLASLEFCISGKRNTAGIFVLSAMLTWTLPILWDETALRTFEQSCKVDFHNFSPMKHLLIVKKYWTHKTSTQRKLCVTAPKALSFKNHAKKSPWV